MKSSCKNKFYGLCVLGLSLFAANVATAQTITTVQELSFGVIAIRDYSAVGRVTIETSGAHTYNSNVFIHEIPQRGEYRLTGGTPNAFYTVSMTPSVTLNGPGGFFTLDNFVVTPAALFTDALGEDTFYITGRLQTQGGGINYPDGTYDTNFVITIAF